MRAIFLVAVLSLFAICECRIPVNTILADAHQCCISSCSAEQKSLLREQMNEYARQNGPNAAQTREYLELALSGAACEGKRAKRTDFTVVSCTQGPYDVANGPATVICSVCFSVAAGIMTTSIYASYSNNGIYKTIYPNNYYYYDSMANTTSMCRTSEMTIPRYSADGLWGVIAYAYGPGYNSFTSGQTNFTILKTKNDVTAPNMTALSPSIFNLNDDTKSIYVSGFDDLSGIYSISVSIVNSATSSSVGYGSFYTQYVNGAYQGQISVSALINLYLYDGTGAGVYALSISISDVAGNSVYLSGSQLTARGLPSTITLASNDCGAGTYRAYNTTGACTPCSVGMYSKAGSFKCQTCPPGQSSSVTGAKSCNMCPPGTSNIGASWACSGCAAGTYSSAPGAALCTPCYPGQYQGNTSATTCMPCQQGYFSGVGATSCTQCAPGTYSYGYSGSCTRCAPGTYAPNAGSSNCMACLPGTYSGLGASSCSSCPAPRTQGPASSNSQMNCY